MDCLNWGRIWIGAWLSMDVSNANLLDAVAITRWLLEREFIRQMPLKSLQQLDRLVRELEVGALTHAEYSGSPTIITGGHFYNELDGFRD